MVKPRTRNTTLYRLNIEDGTRDEMKSVLVQKYIDRAEFQVVEVELFGNPALLSYGEIATDKEVEWSVATKSLVNAPVPVHNKTAAGLIVFPFEDEFYALSYGMGFLLVEGEFIDPGFGLNFMLRAVHPSRVRMLARSILDSRARIDRISVQGGQPIERFGIEYYGEMVGRISGYLSGVNLVCNEPQKGKRQRVLSAVGSDSLKIHLALDPKGLESDIKEIQRVSRSSVPKELKFIDEIRALRVKDPRVSRLRSKLENQFDRDREEVPLALCVPGSCEEYENQANSYRVKVGDGAYSVVDDLDIEDIFERVREFPAEERASVLSSGYISMCEDGQGKSVISRQVKLNKWLAYETSMDGTRYFYYQGSWYEIGSGYLKTIRNRVNELFEKGSSLEFPRWTSSFSVENAYNEHLADEWDGAVCLDGKNIYTTQHPRGIEPCDVLGPNNELVHVKRSSRSGPMSHLFSQGWVSIEALRADREAKASLRELVNSIKPGRLLDERGPLDKVVYGIALRKDSNVTGDSLFTFSQVSLVRAVNALEVANVNVEVAPILQ